MYRYERSGALSGLSRVRRMTLNDAHIFCTPDQIKDEFAGVMRLVEQAYRDLGITKYRYRLSLRDKADKEKYVDNDAMWELGERVLREALDSLGLPYFEAPGCPTSLVSFTSARMARSIARLSSTAPSSARWSVWFPI